MRGGGFSAFPVTFPSAFSAAASFGQATATGAALEGDGELEEAEEEEEGGFEVWGVWVTSTDTTVGPTPSAAAAAAAVDDDGNDDDDDEDASTLGAETVRRDPLSPLPISTPISPSSPAGSPTR